MEVVHYAFAVIGALAVLLLIGLAVAAFMRPEELRHTDPDLLVEIPLRSPAPDLHHEPVGGC
jgi:hypothetical protein